MRGKSPKRTDIQALRAVAVLAVVIYHIWPDRLVGGFMGVDIFFVISGYLMTLTLMRDATPVLTAKDGIRATWSYLVNFYARRIKRLIPAASVTLLGTLGLVFATGNYVTIIETTKQVFSSALFFQNWQLAADSVDYLAATNPPTAVQHFWSLSLEEQFYFVWPLLLLIILLCTVNISVLYKKTKVMGAILPTAILVAMFFAYGYHMTKTDPSAAYFVTFARVWELLLGGVIAFLPALKNYDLKLLLPWLGTAMYTYAIFAWDGVGFPGWHALVPVIGTALVIYGGNGASESKLSFSNLLKAHPIQWIGDISYSLYLWHWPLIVLLPMLLGIYIDGPHGLKLKLGILLLSLLLAWLSYRFVEIPAQKIQLKKRYVYLSFIVIIGGIAGLATFAKNTTDTEIKSQLASLHSLAKAESSDNCIGGKWLVNKDECGNGFGIASPINSQFTSIDPYRKVIGGKFCPIYDYRSDNHDNPDRHCVLGDKESNYQILVYGDSHASHWINALNDIGKRNHVRFVIMDSHTCGSNEIQESVCEDRINYLKESGILDDSKFILLSHLHVSETTYDKKFGNVDLTVEKIKSITKTPLYLLEDTPPASKIIGHDCLIYRMSCKRKLTDAMKSIELVRNNVIEAGILEKKNIIPTYDMFCDEAFCYSSVGGVNVYFNAGHGKNFTNSHITGTFALSLSLPLEHKLKTYGLLPK